MNEMQERVEYLKGIVGAEGLISIDGLVVPVVLLDAKTAYGRVDVQISPSGTFDNSKWVRENRVHWKG